jgi:uncharacterized surface protein with fasciclin (FAS1) repeats
MLRTAAAVLVAIPVVGCGGSDDEVTQPAPMPTAAASAAVVHGPLCDLLPSGDDPGAPATLAGEPADVVLTWIPVITTFEAAVRAAGMGTELDGVTILAPTDDAFSRAFSRARLDRLLLSRPRELRALLEAHVIAGTLSLADLRGAERVTTLAGETIDVVPASGMVRFDDRARTVCADYRASNARIHVIDGVLR